MNISPSVKLKEIAALINAELTGNENADARGLNEIHNVRKGDITFVDHPKYYDKALGSEASFIIINKKVDVPEGKSILVCDDPFDAYVKLIRKYYPFVKNDSMIADSATIGAGTIIQPGVSIGHNVKIGSNCLIHSNVSIYQDCEIGNNVVIHSGAVIGADAYYFQKKADHTRKLESCGRVIIKDHVEIGSLCAIDRGVSTDTVVDEYTKFDNLVQVGHDTYIGKRCLIGAHSSIAGVTKIEDDVILWARVAVNKDLVVKKGAVVLATSAVDKTLEGGKTYFGTPAEIASKKWREMVYIRKLPALFKKIGMGS